MLVMTVEVLSSGGGDGVGWAATTVVGVEMELGEPAFPDPHAAISAPAVRAASPPPHFRVLLVSGFGFIWFSSNAYSLNVRLWFNRVSSMSPGGSGVWAPLPR